MDEILWELRDHSAGLNCGRWDYIFSFIKKFGTRADFILPNRALVTMDRHFLSSYVQLLIKTCHRRDIHAMGGMAAQIPIKNDPAANERGARKSAAGQAARSEGGARWNLGRASGAGADREADFRRAHEDAEPDLREARGRPRHGGGSAEGAGGRDHAKRVCGSTSTSGCSIWNRGSRGNGCVPIYNLMEDAATAEISRAQVWQWVRHKAKLSDGRPITKELVDATIREELVKLKEMLGEDRFRNGKFELAAQLYQQMMTSPQFDEFLTLKAYRYV